MRKGKITRWVRVILGATFIIGGIVGGLYVGLWSMMVNPVLDACAAFDAGKLTATIVGIAVLKFAFGGIVGLAIFTLCGHIGLHILGGD